MCSSRSALALAIVGGDNLCALGVVGVRRAGAAAPVQWDDRFHIGSDTRAMTATLVALLIEDGRLEEHDVCRSFRTWPQACSRSIAG
jgi:CubicO group peptidase (beta-lactamase class C family)